MNRNVDKSEICTFSALSNDSIWQPVPIGNQQTWVNNTPRFLCLILDRSLKFNTYMNKLTVPLTSSFCIIQVTAHTSWGWYKSTLKVSFHVLIHSMLNYTAPAWYLWLFGINLSCLDHLQNHALRLVTVHLVSTSFEG